MNTISDLNSIVELYKELQEVFQNNSLGQKQLSGLNEQIKSFQRKEVHTKPVTIIKKKSPEEKLLSVKSTNAKAKSNKTKNTSVL